ncbi:MAG: FtsX-like permease family protein [Pseudomonadota bacterium]
MVRALLPLALVRSSLRFYAQHPWQACLALVSVALGAAIVVAVGLANQSALQAFDQAITALSPNATHRVISRRGAVPAPVLTTLVREHGVSRVWPELQVSGTVYRGGQRVGEMSLHAAMPLLQPLPAADGGRQPLSADALAQWLGGAPVVALSDDLAKAFGVQVGDTLDFRLGDRRHALQVDTLFDAPGLVRAGIADVSLVQSLSGGDGSFEAVSLSLSDDQARTLQRRLAPELQLVSLGQSRVQFENVTRAFRISVRAMSLLTVLVGAFLVYNTLVFLVLRRRRTLGAARLIGATRGQLFALLLFEAVVLGMLGAVLGLVLGVALATGVLGLLDRVFVDIYRGDSAPRLLLAPAQFLIAFGVTMFSVCCAALGPAREAALTDPTALIRQALPATAESPRFVGATLLGLGLMGCGAAIVVLGDGIVGAYLGLFCVVIGYGAVVPSLIHGLLIVVAPALRTRGVQLRLILTTVRQSLSRTALAVSALALALAAVMGIASMVGAFRASVDTWLEQTLSSDLYVTPVRDEGAQPVGPDQQAALAAVPGVASISAGRRLRARVNALDTELLVIQPGAHSVRGFPMRSTATSTLFDAFEAGEGVLVSEPLARRLSLSPGDAVRVTWSHGDAESRVLGVYRDYSSSQGVMALGHRLAQRAGDARGFNSVGLALSDSADKAAVFAATEALASRFRTPYRVTDSEAIRTQSLAVFDRTFAITDVITLLVTVVAVLGVFGALTAVLMERQGEFAIMRAVGLTPRQLQGLLFGLAAVLGCLAALFALPLGAALAWVLTDVINTRAFGWSIDLHFRASVFFSVGLLGPLAAIAAAVMPARQRQAPRLGTVTRV